MAIAAANDRQFERLAEALGDPEWLRDPRFQANQTRRPTRTSRLGEFNPEFFASRAK